MPLSFQVNKKDTRPLYEQLTGHIITLCRRSVLRPGDRLPPERDLAAQLHISRGTVKKAIESLKYQGYLESFQGSGNYVTTPRPPKPTAASTAEQAAEICSYAFFALQELHLPYEQISHLVHSYLERMERQCPQVRLALIDCAPETLRCCRSQLDQLPCVKLETYVLGDLEKDVSLLGEAATCDLIFTTSKHFEQMQKLLPSCEDRLYYFALAIPPNTIVQLATLSPQARVGVVCETERFYEIICQNLASLVPAAPHQSGFQKMRRGSRMSPPWDRWTLSSFAPSAVFSAAVGQPPCWRSFDPRAVRSSSSRMSWTRVPSS